MLEKGEETLNYEGMSKEEMEKDKRIEQLERKIDHLSIEYVFKKILLYCKGNEKVLGSSQKKVIVSL